MVAIDIPKSFGALLIGGLFASLFSGFVVIQVIVYFKLYPEDHRRLKTLVLIVWLLDTGHTIAIWLSLWGYFIDKYGDAAGIDNIHKSLALSVIIPAILTFFVHIFYTHRIFMLSKRNYFLTLPIATIAVLRLVSASTTTAYMLKLHTFTNFKQEVRWIFTTGLALSSSVDILITTSLCILLQSSRTGLDKSNIIIDSLIMYTFETGALTCAGTIASMLCWSIIPNNLVFMGLHFVIGKLYANSLLVTLNTRVNTRERLGHNRSNGSGDHGVGVHVLDPRRRRIRDSDELVLSGVRSDLKGVSSKSQTLEVNIQQSVQYA